MPKLEILNEFSDQIAFLVNHACPVVDFIEARNDIWDDLSVLFSWILSHEVIEFFMEECSHIEGISFQDYDE